jgi:hypothetical protein
MESKLESEFRIKIFSKDVDLAFNLNRLRKDTIQDLSEESWIEMINIIRGNWKVIKSVSGKTHSECEETITYLDNFRKYGYTSWYCWANDKWGSKWNAYDQDEGEDYIKFDTPWSTPEPILRKISAIFPDVEFRVLFAEEDIGSNCGILNIIGGEVVNFDSRDGDDEFACDVRGYDYEEYKSDMEEE